MKKTLYDIYIYDLDESKFDHDGFILKDFEDLPEISRMINGRYAFMGIYDLYGQLSDMIKKGAIIRARVPDGSYQKFRIQRPEVTDDTIEFIAQHICYDVNRNFIEDFFEANGSGSKIMSGLFNAQAFQQKFTFKSDIITTHQFTAKEGHPVDIMIGSNNGGQNLTGVTSGELDMYDNVLDLKQRIGQDNGFRIDFGINLEAIVESVSEEEAPNTLYLVGKTPEGDFDENKEPIKVKYLEAPGMKITDDNRVISKYTNEDHDTKEGLIKWANSVLFGKQKVHIPKVSHKLSIVDLAGTMEYKDFTNLVKLNIGDTVHGVLQRGRDEIEERMIEYISYPTIGEYKEIGLGNDMGYYTRSQDKTIENTLKEMTKVENVIYDKLINATQLITGTTNGNIMLYPTKRPRELRIMDTDDAATAKDVWRWNLGGLAHSSNGVNGPFNIGITADGQIVADIITAGQFNAEMLRVGFNGIGDVLQLVSNALQIYNNKVKIMELTKKGLEFWRGTDSIGIIGTTGKNFNWIGDVDLELDRALYIGLNGGDFTKISNDNDDGIWIPSKKILTKNPNTRLTIYCNQGIDILTDNLNKAISIDKNGTSIMGGLKVDGKPVTGGGTGGGSWNGEYPPEVITQMEKNAWRVWVFFLNKGWNPRAIAGMLGNMESESWINPDQHEISGGGGYGLVQWTPASKLIDWCNANGLDYKTVESQCMRIQYEVDNNLQWFANPQRPDLPYISFSTFTHLSDEKIAAEYFIAFYEHPANPNQPIRAQQATAWYNKFKDLVQPGGKYGYPVLAGTPVTSWFGPRWGTMHNGIDFGGVIGDPIFAAQSGTVTYSYYDNDMGEWVVIKHDNDAYMTGYAHNSARLVKVGDKVSKGQQIARMGSTGDSTGPHCHFAVQTAQWSGYVDPAPFLGLTPP